MIQESVDKRTSELEGIIRSIEKQVELLPCHRINLREKLKMIAEPHEMEENAKKQQSKVLEEGGRRLTYVDRLIMVVEVLQRENENLSVLEKEFEQIV